MFERTFSQIEKSLSMSNTSATSFYIHQKKSKVLNEYDKYVIKELIDKEKKKVINKMNYRPKRVKITNKELKGLSILLKRRYKMNMR